MVVSPWVVFIVGMLAGSFVTVLITIGAVMNLVMRGGITMENDKEENEDV